MAESAEGRMHCIANQWLTNPTIDVVIVSRLRQRTNIHSIHNLAIEQRAQDDSIAAHVAIIISRAIGKAIGLTNNRTSNVLTQSSIGVVVWTFPLENDIILRIVADRVEAVRVARSIGSKDPRCEAAFKATVLDDVDGWCGGTACGGGEACRGGATRIAATG